MSKHSHSFNGSVVPSNGDQFAPEMDNEPLAETVPPQRELVAPEEPRELDMKVPNDERFEETKARTMVEDHQEPVIDPRAAYNCPDCKGEGINVFSNVICPKCLGKGKV